MDKKRMPIYGIKGKLVSACCMLLVAVIMVVSSTYAWFTLSTAPEVKGITTSIGANGALEIRLNSSATGDKNIEPGNVVDLGDDKYGLKEIILLPSKLLLNDDGTINNKFLEIPQYNSDGRFSGTSGERTEAGTYVSGTGFVAGSATGVRAVGVASGLTDRQLAYRNAKYAASTNAGLATNKAASSLNTNGSILGNIVIKKATVEGATYTKEELASLNKIIDDLLGTEDTTGVLQYIEDAYKQMIIAFAASKPVDDIAGPDVANAIYSTVKANLANETLTLEGIAENDGIVLTVDGTTREVDLAGTPLLAGIEAFLATQTKVEAAKTAYKALDAEATEYTWENVSSILTTLIDTDKVTVNKMTASAIRNDISGFASTVMSQGINIALNEGAGVYEEIADQCGDYSATVTMKNVIVNGMTFDDLTANMATVSGKKPDYYLTTAQATFVTSLEPTGAASGDMPMTEFYGYIIDLVFKTNAANSSLLLQTEATDRIYEDNNNEATQGGGSYMTYQSTDTSFTTDQVKGLMENIRIVFFTPAEVGADGQTTSNKILAYAMLDTENATVGIDGVTAKIYLYETVDTYTFTPDGGTETKYFVRATKNDEGTTYKYYDYKTGADVTETVKTTYADAETAIPAEFGTATKVNRALTGAKNSEDAPAITALAQNADVKVSALVYLDGEHLTNADVAATQKTSVTGKMNLQFSSSAELVPMEYGDLHTPTTND